MAKETKKHKKSRVWLWLPVLGLAVYLGVQVWSSTNRPYRTQTAVSVTLTDSLEVRGVVVRQEQAILQDAAGVVGHIAADAERVSAGTEVARVFESAAAAQSFASANLLQTRSDTLRQAQTDGSNAGTDVNLIMQQVNSDLYDYIALLNTGSYAGLSAVRDDLRYALNKLDVAVGRETGYDELIGTLEAQRDGLRMQEGAAASVWAPCTGFYFYDVDGYETLTVEQAMAMQPAQLDDIAAVWPCDAAAAVGKMVTSYRWYYLCTVDARQLPRFEVGQKITLNFIDAGVAGFEAQVYQIGEADADGRAVVAFSCEQMDSRLSGLRFETAELQFATYTGIRINKDALHINKDGHAGVYIKFGTLVRFCRIDPIFETETYILVPLQPRDGQDVNQVSLYDEIIVEGSDLFDGKLL